MFAPGFGRIGFGRIHTEFAKSLSQAAVDANNAAAINQAGGFFKNLLDHLFL